MPALDLIVKLVGWTFVIVPVGLFLFVSGHMIFGIAKEDSFVQVLVFLFGSILLIGAGILAFAYGTSYLAGI